ncbi:nucleoside triphosphate pyrophosphohydrolase [Patescibacteria group bacterium]|nr:nucleoside triphosphate pyrophosphohydrolase [Patescibacteria group bacterium]MBU0964322.1 nucleoside triphosphate pyrophosphohydrolase [Patescibacteria group bacterium]
MKYDKLVRDKIPEIIKKDNLTPVTHIADKQEYWNKLKKKLLEETGEFMATEKIDELADIIEVINALAKTKNITPAELERIRAKKSKTRGSFDKKIILEHTK